MLELGGTLMSSTEPRGIDRRTILSAAAWSAPVVALAVAAPAAAASGCATTNLTSGTWSISGGTLVDPNQEGWTFPNGANAKPAALSGTSATSDYVFTNPGSHNQTTGLNAALGFVSSAQGPASGDGRTVIVNYLFPVLVGKTYTLQAPQFKLWSALGSTDQTQHQHVGQSVLVHMIPSAAETAIEIGKFSYSYPSGGPPAPYTAVTVVPKQIVTHAMAQKTVVPAASGNLTIRYTFQLPNRQVNNSTRDYNADIWALQPAFAHC